MISCSNSDILEYKLTLFYLMRRVLLKCKSFVYFVKILPCHVRVNTLYIFSHFKYTHRHTEKSEFFGVPRHFSNENFRQTRHLISVLISQHFPHSANFALVSPFRFPTCIRSNVFNTFWKLFVCIVIWFCEVSSNKTNILYFFFSNKPTWLLVAFIRLLIFND